MNSEIIRKMYKVTPKTSGIKYNLTRQNKKPVWLHSGFRTLPCPVNEVSIEIPRKLQVCSSWGRKDQGRCWLCWDSQAGVLDSVLLRSLNWVSWWATFLSVVMPPKFCQLSYPASLSVSGLGRCESGNQEERLPTVVHLTLCYTIHNDPTRKQWCWDAVRCTYPQNAWTLGSQLF